MKRLFKKICVISSAIFFFFFAFILNSNHNISAHDYTPFNYNFPYSEYHIFQLTITDIPVYEYTFDTETRTIIIDEESLEYDTFKIPFLSSDYNLTRAIGYAKYDINFDRVFRVKSYSSRATTVTNIQDSGGVGRAFEFINDLTRRKNNEEYTLDNIYDTTGVAVYMDNVFTYNDDKVVKSDDLNYLLERLNAIFNGEDLSCVQDVTELYKATDNQEYADKYIEDNNYHTDEEYLEYGSAQKQEGFQLGADSIDTEMYQQIGYEQGYEAGVKSVDITSDNEEAINKYIEDNNMKTETEYNQYGETKYSEGYTKGQEDGYSTGYEAGVNSLDIDNIKAQEYEKGYNDGYETGVSSVDITIDNTIAINNYIIENNMKTETEYLAYGEQKYQAGISSVDRNAIITDYIATHKLYNESEYLSYGNTRYSEGMNSVDITSDNDYVIQQYISSHDMKTRTEYDAYGEFMYQEGVNSVDITSDNQKVIDDFIKSNNYYSLEEYVDYGVAEYFRGYTNGAESVDTESYRLLGYEQGYKDGEASVDVTIDNQEAINKYIKENHYHSDGDYMSYGNNKYSQGFEDGVNSVYGNIEDDQVVKEYVTNYIKVNKYYTSTQYIDNYDKGYADGYAIGLSLSGIDEIKASEYQRGYNDGYAVGYSEGEYSVDITKDNDVAIDLYITQNHYHPHWEFELNFDLGWEAGTYYVYNNLDVDLEVQKYVKNYIEKNNYYTEKEFTDNYKLGYDNGYSQGYDDGYDLGESNVDKVITNELLIETMRERLGKGLTINLLTKGNMNLLIKNYDLDIDDTGDTKITIHYGQDKYEVKTETIVEVVPGEGENGENNSSQSEDMSKIETILVFILMIGCGIGAIILIIFIFIVLTKSSKKNKKKNNYLRRKKS